MVFQDLTLIVAATLTACAISNLSMPSVIKIADFKNLIDASDDDRRIQDRVIPTLGGLGIFSAFIISYAIWGQHVNIQEFPFVIASLFILFLMGVKNDSLKLKTFAKFGVQLTAVLVLVYGGGVHLSGLDGVFGAEDGFWISASLLTVIIMLVLINAYNLIDGIDGLAAGTGVIIAGTLGIWFWGAGFFNYALLSFVFSGALIGFLAYNMFPAKLSLGSTGAMSIGFILGFLAIQFTVFNHSLTNQAWHVSNGEVLAVSILIVPLIYAMRVIFRRINSRIGFIDVDTSKIRQIIQELGITQQYIVFIVWMFNLFMIGLAYLTMPLSINIQLGIVIGVALLILPVISLGVFLGQKLLNIRINKTKANSVRAGLDTN